ncbi:MAG TPA: DUF4097 family beta strand repeat-containing protein [Terriglobia bacterium]|jgi:hypothetical protein|nr:DUF4097 family beta strand repeat-containing protein [Terriglobia bacterium]
MTTGEPKLKSKYLMALAATFLAFSTAAAAAEGRFERTLQVTGPVDLTVQTGAGTVTVRTGDASKVEVRGTIRAWGGLFSEDEARKRVSYIESHPPIEQNGNVIRIGKAGDSHMQRNLTISYDLVVPPNTKLTSKTGSGNQTIDGISGPLEASIGSGDIKASNIASSVQASTGSGQVVLVSIAKDVRVTTGSGGVHATGIGGNVRASTGSGEVTIEEAGAGDVHVNTASGNIVLKKVRGLVQAKTASGSITAEGGGQSPWYLETVSGNVSVRVPPNLGFDLHAHTVSGSISTNRPLTLQGAISKREINGKAGSGGFLLDVSTVSGNINIDWVA